MVGLRAADRVFVALDIPTVADARALTTRLGPQVQCYKIGLELLFGGGLAFAAELKAAGKTIFLDMKLLDIGATVEKSVANFGVDYLTVHGIDNKTMHAAVAGRGSSGLKLLAVTVLTNLDQADLAQQGITGMNPEDLVIHRAGLAKAAGFDGVIASGQEARRVRAAMGQRFLIVTPGIRPAGSAANDQARVVTPAAAIRDGASHLVVGRPITAAADPAAAAAAILAEVQSVPQP
jgi:orotidine-5'-phosphate decarboxylase